MMEDRFKKLCGEDYEVLANAVREQYAGLSCATRHFVNITSFEQNKSHRVLYDLGCGTGISTRLLLDALGVKNICTESAVVGLDINTDMLDYASEKTWTYGKNQIASGASKPLCYFQEGSLDMITRSDDTAADVFSSFVFHNIDPDKRLPFLKILYDKLQPGRYFGSYDKLFRETGEVAYQENATLMSQYVPRLMSLGHGKLTQEFIAHELKDIQDERILTVASFIDLMQDAGFSNVHEFESADSPCARFVIGKKPN